MEEKQKMKHSGLSIAALVVSILGCGCCSFVSLIMAIIDLAGGDKNKKHTLSIVALIISVIGMMIGGAFVLNQYVDKAKDNNATEQIVESSDDQTTKQNDDQTTEQDDNQATEAAQSNEKAIFETGEVYSENGFVIEVTDVTDKAVTFTITNNNEDEYNVKIMPIAVDYTMDEGDYGFSEDVAPGKKLEANVGLTFHESLDDAQSMTFVFSLGRYLAAGVSQNQIGDIPITLYSNLYDENAEIVYGARDVIYEDDVVEVGLIRIEQNEVQLSVINKTDDFYEYNIVEAAVNEWSYDVNPTVFLRYRDVELLPHAQDYLTIDYSDFVNEKSLTVEEFSFKLDLFHPENRMDTHKTDEIIAK